MLVRELLLVDLEYLIEVSAERGGGFFAAFMRRDAFPGHMPRFLPRGALRYTLWVSLPYIRKTERGARALWGWVAGKYPPRSRPKRNE